MLHPIKDLQGRVIGHIDDTDGQRFALEGSDALAEEPGTGRTVKARTVALVAGLLVAVAGLAYLLEDTREEPRAAWTVETVAVDGYASVGAVDVDRNGIISRDGRVIGSLSDGSGDRIRATYLERAGAGEPSHLVADGVAYCDLLRSGDALALAVLVDATTASNHYGTDDYSARVARAAVSTFCSAFN